MSCCWCSSLTEGNPLVQFLVLTDDPSVAHLPCVSQNYVQSLEMVQRTMTVNVSVTVVVCFLYLWPCVQQENILVHLTHFTPKTNILCAFLLSTTHFFSEKKINSRAENKSEKWQCFGVCLFFSAATVQYLYITIECWCVYTIPLSLNVVT